MTTTTTAAPTRGQRNHNPGNLKYNPRVHWHGLTGQDPQGFAIFDTDDSGLTAMATLLDLYVHDYGYLTISDIVRHYAPDGVMKVHKYADYVADQCRTNAFTELDWPIDLAPLMQAMVRFENGRQWLTSAQYLAAACRATNARPHAA